jgi:hypothetical protein
MYIVEFRINTNYIIHYEFEEEVKLQEIIITATRRFRHSYFVDKESVSGYIYKLDKNGNRTYMGRF